MLNANGNIMHFLALHDFLFLKTTNKSNCNLIVHKTITTSSIVFWLLIDIHVYFCDMYKFMAYPNPINMLMKVVMNGRISKNVADL